MSSLHEILLRPTDVLFFRDGRPMGGSFAGHTAAWPLPDVTNHALHAALHRAGLEGVHHHDHKKPDGREKDSRKFGSLVTAGPFPVKNGTWYFPRPADADAKDSIQVTLRPVSGDWRQTGSLPKPLRHAVGNTRPPEKQVRDQSWIDKAGYEACLRENAPATSADPFLRDKDLAATEHMIGIGIDPERQTQDGDRFYSAHYLRLREDCSLGLFASVLDKRNGNPEDKRDLIKELFRNNPPSIVVGGQQRVCTASVFPASSSGGLPLPRGIESSAEFHQLPNGKLAVKWVLLSPAIWPEIGGTSKRGKALHSHPGGWLPNWICPETGKVLLQSMTREERKRRRKLNYASEGYESQPDIDAALVAAIIPKPIAVTGWALPGDSDRAGGAKSTHLAVPAGAVYYFEAADPAAAEKLAAALNWHAGSDGREIRNRRSTLLGEKGYGIGVCGSWIPIER